ncbi:MAG: YaeQ family protein [Hylemonella sp.]|nr:YaeQ family protein [Hylemonella sp.]
MALKSTVFKANLQIADIDHGYYADHALTLARHPSETDERMMVRLMALALNAHQLQDICQGDGVMAFGAGLSDPDEPDVFLRDFTGLTRLWIEVGQPDDRALIKASAKADSLVLYCFNHAAEVWWRGIENKLSRLQNLSVFRVPSESAQALTALAQRNMQLQATLQESVLTLGDAAHSIDVECLRWK